MIVSLNEAEVMATKAAWGAGRPWGLAQDAGRAVSTLEAMRLPGATSLLDVLAATDGAACETLRPASVQTEWWQAERPMCPVLVGAFIADLGVQSEEVKLRRVHTPLLLVPFAQWHLTLWFWTGTTVISARRMKVFLRTAPSMPSLPIRC